MISNALEATLKANSLATDPALVSTRWTNSADHVLVVR
ncbi:hypothetical protein ACVWZ6_002670 [Bradyrhizobium sp. GM6.1]